MNCCISPSLERILRVSSCSILKNMRLPSTATTMNRSSSHRRLGASASRNRDEATSWQSVTTTSGMRLQSRSVSTRTSSWRRFTMSPLSYDSFPFQVLLSTWVKVSKRILLSVLTEM